MTDARVLALAQGADERRLTPVVVDDLSVLEQSREGDLRVFASDSAGIGGPVPDLQVGTSGTGLTAEDFGGLWRSTIRGNDLAKPRSMQSDSGVLGASDALGCQHRAVLTVRRITPSDQVSKGAAIAGTALHEALLPGFGAMLEAKVETDLTLTLPDGSELPVHPDLIDPTEPSVTDLKTVKDLAYRRKQGPEPKHKAQVNLYYLAARQAGLVPAQGTVRLLYVSMTDIEDTWVWQEPFDQGWVDAAQEWFTGVRYAVEHDEDGAKDANPNFCQRFCGFYSICKPPLVDAAGELTSPGLRERAQVAFEARAQRKHFETLEKQTVEELRGVSGRADQVQVTSTWVNSGAGYWKVDLSEVRR